MKLTENSEELQQFYSAGRRKVSKDKAELLAQIEEVRVRLEAAARDFTLNYQQECEAADRGEVEDSYRGTIQPFWRRIINSGTRDRIVGAGYDGRAAQITDITLYGWPELAMRALDEGGIYPDRLKRDDTLKWLNPEVKPCIIDAWTILDPHSSIKPPDEFEEIIVACYRGDGRGLVGISETGLSIHRLHEIDSRAYSYQGLRYYFNPSEDTLPPLPEYIHPRLINEFAAQIRSGRCDEYVGALLVRAEERGR